MQNDLNTEVLESLATADSGDEFSTAKDMTDDAVRAALEKLLERKKIRAAESAAESILELLNIKDQRKATAIREIRLMRSRIEELKKNLDLWDKMTDYGNTSTNWLPLAVELGLVCKRSLLNRKLSEFNPKEESE